MPVAKRRSGQFEYGKSREGGIRNLLRTQQNSAFESGLFRRSALSYGFIEADADVLGQDKPEEAKALRARALYLYLRARGYCLRSVSSTRRAG